MTENSFLTYEQLRQQIEGFQQFGHDKTTLDNFAKSGLILQKHDNENGGYRYSVRDITNSLDQRQRNSK